MLRSDGALGAPSENAGGGTAVKLYWIALGLGTLTAVVGGVMWVASNHQSGLLLVLSGLVIAIIGLVMVAVEWAMNKGKRSAES
jgi:uncharacterized sodium:solute symporter family permease YidK